MRNLFPLQSNWLAFLLYGGLIACGIWQHEPWRDEMQAWMLVADGGTSLGEILHTVRYEGHPAVWYLILYACQQFTDGIWLPQLVHALLIATAAWLWLRNGPGPNWFRIGSLFGYFFLYEYAVLFRNYAIGILLLFWIGSWMKEKGWLGLCVPFLLLFHTNIFVWLIGLVFWMAMLWWKKGDRKPSFWLANVLVIASAGLAIWDMLPPADYGFASPWMFYPGRIGVGLASVWKVFVPMPMPGLHSWNHNLLDSVGIWPQAIGGLLILLLCTWSLARSWRAQCFFLATTAALLLFFMLKYEGFLRHQGHLFIVYLLSLWVGEKWPGGLGYFDKKASLQNLWLILVLLLQISGGLWAWAQDVRYPFSQAGNLAKELKRAIYDDVLIIADPDFACSPAAGLSGRTFYYPTPNRNGSYVIWDQKQRSDLYPDKELQRLLDRLRRDEQPFILLRNTAIPVDSLTNWHLQMHQHFSPAIQVDETYWLYQATTRDK
ncbi:MAG: hypothetical protein AAF206_10710 [Bacteroidota bacterium]